MSATRSRNSERTGNSGSNGSREDSHRIPEILLFLKFPGGGCPPEVLRDLAGLGGWHPPEADLYNLLVFLRRAGVALGTGKFGVFGVDVNEVEAFGIHFKALLLIALG